MRTHARLVAPGPGYRAPMACRFSELVVNSRDPEALAAFWAAVLDYRVLGRDQAAIADLVGDLLGPLQHSRTGVEVLLAVTLNP